MLTYLYCLLDSNVLDAKPDIEIVEIESFYAVISAVPESEFGEAGLKKNLSNLTWIEQTVRGHESVIEFYRQRATVAPFKFPSLFVSRDSLAQFLKTNKARLGQLLQSLAGKEEWGVKVYMNPSQLQTFLAKSEEIKKIDDQLSRAPAGKAYLLRKKREILTSNPLSLSLQQIIENLFRRLGARSVKSMQNPVLPKTVTEREDEMILNGAFLIEQKNVDLFLSEAELLKADYPYLTIEISGAWAAYNFCS
jgi:hypothetical protein